jgi:Tfp pilus assembly protein PilO
MKFGPREKVLVAILAAIPVAEWWFVFRPSNARKAEMIRRLEAQQAKLSAANRAAAVVGDLMKEIDSLTKAIEFFHSMLPTEKEIDKVLRETWQLAETNRLVTKSIRPLGRASNTGFASAASNYAEQRIDIQLEGDFRGFYAFLLDLENQQRIVKIREMTLEELDKNTPGRIKAHFVICVFFEGVQPSAILLPEGST